VVGRNLASRTRFELVLPPVKERITVIQWNFAAWIALYSPRFAVRFGVCFLKRPPQSLPLPTEELIFVCGR
jgi:hypothetical protein